MHTTRIRYFLTYCKSLNFSNAARELNISQPALTRALARLEEELGAPLVRREGKRTHLTPFGTAMLRPFKEFVDVARKTELQAQEFLHGPTQSIKLAIMCTIGATRVSRMLAHYHTHFAQSKIVMTDVSYAQIIDHLLDGNADCAIVGTDITDEKRIRSLPLYDEPLVVAHSTQHPFCARESVSLEEVFREPYLDRTQCEFRHMFSQNVGGSPNVTVLSDNEFWIQSLIRENVGVSIMPKELLLLDGLRTTLINGDKIRRTVSLIVPTGREDTLDIRNFLQVAREFRWSDTN